MTTVVDPPEPLYLDEALAHIRADSGPEDDLVSSLIIAAREYVEDYTGLVLTARSITETAVSLGAWIDLDSWPIVSVDAVRYTPIGGAAVVLATTAYALSLTARPVRIIPVSSGWGVARQSAYRRGGLLQPTLPVEIDVTAGYATPELVPQTIKQAMLLLIAHWYDNRSAVEAGVRAAAIDLPLAVEALLRRWRLRRV